MIYQSDDGLEFLKKREEFRKDAYLDIGGVPTIGYGSLHLPSGKLVALGNKITENDATILLSLECNGICKKFDKLITTTLKQSQSDALVSFVYNVGMTAFRNSTLLKIINENAAHDKYIATSKELEFNFMRWNKAHVDGKLIQVKGLTNRRRMECNLFTRGDYGL